jgi:hypothetical protein
MKVYVTEPSGLYVTDLGHRDYGDFFEVDEPTATELASRPGLTLEDPRKPKRENKVKESTDVRRE